MIFEPNGLATGIGSMPFLNPADALPMIKEYLPEIPHWPQLPQRGRQEHLVYQFLKPLVKYGLLLEDSDKIFFDTTRDDWDTRLTEFYSIYLAAEEGDPAALNEFALPVEAAAGFYAFLEEMAKGTGPARMLKGQVVGPVSAAFQLKDERGRFAYYDEQLRDLVVKSIAASAAWQGQELGRFGLPVMIFIDDPALGIYGPSKYITVSRGMLLEDFSIIAQAIHGAGAMAGAHSCDAIDWSLLFESELQVVSFDAYNYFSSLIPFVESLKDFLDRGGSLAWGLVPTLNNRVLDEDENSLLGILNGQWSELAGRGIHRDTLVKRCLITPACGTGLLDLPEAEKIYQLTCRISQRIRSGKGVF